MILTIADEYVAIGHNGHALESFELRIARAPGAEGLQETAIGIEDLYAIVARVGHKDIALIIHSDTTRRKYIYSISIYSNYSIEYSPWKLELAIVGAFAAHRGQHLAIHIEYLRH